MDCKDSSWEMRVGLQLEEKRCGWREGKGGVHIVEARPGFLFFCSRKQVCSVCRCCPPPRLLPLFSKHVPAWYQATLSPQQMIFYSQYFSCRWQQTITSSPSSSLQPVCPAQLVLSQLPEHTNIPCPLGVFHPLMLRCLPVCLHCCEPSATGLSHIVLTLLLSSYSEHQKEKCAQRDFPNRATRTQRLSCWQCNSFVKDRGVPTTQPAWSKPPRAISLSQYLHILTCVFCFVFSFLALPGNYS